MSNLKDQEQAGYTADPATVDLSLIIETYKALLTGDNLPERVAVQTVDLQALLESNSQKTGTHELALTRIAERLIKWDKDYPINCHNGYVGLKELDSLISDASTALADREAVATE